MLLSNSFSDALALLGFHIDNQRDGDILLRCICGAGRAVILPAGDLARTPSLIVFITRKPRRNVCVQVHVQNL